MVMAFLFKFPKSPDCISKKKKRERCFSVKAFFLIFLFVFGQNGRSPLRLISSPVASPLAYPSPLPGKWKPPYSGTGPVIQLKAH